MKTNGIAEMNIGVLADDTSVLWEYRNLLMEITGSGDYTVNTTLSKDVATCRRVMTTLNGGYDLLIIDNSRQYAVWEEKLLKIFFDKAESLRILVHYKEYFCLKSLAENEEAPIRLTLDRDREILSDLIEGILEQVYKERRCCLEGRMYHKRNGKEKT